jgi:hypothetical protein
VRRLRGLAPSAFAIGTSIAAAGCGSPSVHLGGDPDILWWTNNESGDTSDWTAGGPLVGRIWSSGPLDQLSASTDQARSGRYSLRASIVTGSGYATGGPPMPPPPAGVLAIREANLPSEGYYSAWYYIPEAVFPSLSSFWLVFKFRSRTTPTDPSTVVELWDIDLGSLSPGAPGGQLALDLYRHSPSLSVARQPRIAMPPAVPTGRWFQIEAFYRSATDTTGALTVWQDGVMVFDIEGQGTAPSSYVEWSVGSVSGGLTPTPAATLYIDDAAVSTRQLGPSFPPFSSGD